MDIQKKEQGQTTTNISTHQLSNSKLLLVAFVSFLVGGVGGFFLGINQFKSSSSYPLSTPYATSEKSSPVTKKPAASPSLQTTLPHEFLPGFSLVYPQSWTLDIKQFRTIDAKGFTSNYFPTCHERCMGIRLSDTDNNALELVFDVAFDDNDFKCSNSVEFSTIGNDWYRIKDSSGYFYARDITLDRTLGESNFPAPIGSVNDEWSAVKNTHYAICLRGSGNFLKQKSPVEPGEDGTGVSILLEHPRIIGVPDTEMIKSFDQIVISLQGI